MATTLVGPVGRPKKKRPESGGASPEFRNVTLRASRDWAEWADRASQHCRINLSTLLDVALCEYVRARGFEEPPPPRY